MTDFLHEREWLTSSGTVLPDPRFEPIVKAARTDSAGKKEEEEETAPNKDGSGGGSSGTDEEMEVLEPLASE
ncbi:hypothetical protein NP233_g2986 [Leucocoprinus birnbaumii]|uniref:Uncharacterized protein n=1 Tax=Leucocoprinus birnbaumii TaxID=56174 RepID=A0AAD5W3Q8_9AGAR|nr:hypothetical protein NP233_g2986 [Leucocoprinus birnbaumii]